MTWFRTISSTEYLYITLFLGLYMVYGLRLYLISRKLKISIARLVLKFLLRGTYFALILIAFLGPSFGDIKKEIKAIGKDIYFAIDVSASMNAEDVSPSRLEKAKFELANSFKKLSSDRIGLIVFAEEAYIHCPLTYDHSAATLFLQGVSTNLVSNSGTNTFAPMKLALEKFTAKSMSGEADQVKLLVLITDGEDFGNQSVETILERFQKEKIKLMVIGIGSDEGGKIPIKNGYKTDQFGKPIVSVLQTKKLKKIAEQTGGEYYEISPTQNEMEQAIKEISLMEGTLKGTHKIESGANKYFYFLFLAFVLIMLDVLISVKTIKI